MEEKDVNEGIPFAANSSDSDYKDIDTERKDLFRKLTVRERFMRWFVFRFLNKTVWKCDMNGFKIHARRFWIDIRSIAKNEWNLRIGMHDRAFSYFSFLLAQIRKAENEGNIEYAATLKEQFSFFATHMNLTSTFMITDEKFTKAILREINWSVSRLLKKSAELSKGVTKEKNDADEAFMQSAVERGQMNRRERRKAQRDERKAMKKAIKSDPTVRNLAGLDADANAGDNAGDAAES